MNEADVLDRIDPESLRMELAGRKGQSGVRPLRTLLDRHTYRMHETELERRFYRIVRKAGLPLPETQDELGGRTDFEWPTLGLVCSRPTAGAITARLPVRPTTTAACRRMPPVDAVR